MKHLEGISTTPPSRALFFKMKPLIGLFFLVPSTINVLAKAYTNEDAVIGPDGVKCTLSTVSVRKPDNLLTFDDGHCVYSTSTDQCQSGVALFQFYSPQNVCPQEVLSGQNPSQTIVPCCVHIECGDRNEGKCVNTPASGFGNCKGELKVDEDRCPEGKSKTMCCIPSQGDMQTEYTNEYMTAVDQGTQAYQEGLRHDKYPFGDELWSSGAGDSGFYQDEGEVGVDCLAWGINCPIS